MASPAYLSSYMISMEEFDADEVGARERVLMAVHGSPRRYCDRRCSGVSSVTGGHRLFFRLPGSMLNSVLIGRGACGMRRSRMAYPIP